MQCPSNATRFPPTTRGGTANPPYTLVSENYPGILLPKVVYSPYLNQELFQIKNSIPKMRTTDKTDILTADTKIIFLNFISLAQFMKLLE